MSELSESNIHLSESGFHGKSREFVLFFRSPEGQDVEVQPLDLLALDRAARIIQRQGQVSRVAGLRLALARLLLPLLQYRGSGRHLVVEPWDGEDLTGESLPEDTPIPLAQNLARQQAEDFRLVSTSPRPPAGSLAEVFWEVCTDLPRLTDCVNDPDVNAFIEALYFHLVPQGTGFQGVSLRDISARVLACRKLGFRPLPLGLDPRQARSVFKKVLAVVVQGASQVAGEVARELIGRQLLAVQGADAAKLSANEEVMLDFRYGSCSLLGDINVNFLYGIGPLVGILIDHLYRLHALDAPQDERDSAARTLHQCLHLLASFRQRRKATRREERQAVRLRRPQKNLRGKRRDAELEPDEKTAPPERRSEEQEELQALADKLLLRLGKNDRLRFEALIDADFNYPDAAEKLGITVKKFHQQWRQTTKKNLQRVMRELALSPDETDC